MLSEVKRYYFLVSFLAFACFPMMPNAAQSIVFGLFLFCSLLYKFDFRKLNKSLIVFVVLTILLLILTICRSEDKIELKGKLLQLIPFILGVIITFLSPKLITKKELDIVKNIFLLSLVIYMFLYINYFIKGYEIYNKTVILHIEPVKTFFFDKLFAIILDKNIYSCAIYGQEMILNNYDFFYHYFYLNILFLIGIFFCIEYVLSTKKLRFKTYYFILLIVLILFMSTLPSKSKILLLGLLIFYGVSLYFKVSRQIKYFIGIILAILTLIIGLKYKSYFLNIELVRYTIYKVCHCNLSLSDYIFGIGIGDIKSFINMSLHKVIVMKNHSNELVYFNTHNQYLEFLLSFGVFGLIAILYSCYKWMKITSRINSIPGNTFLVCIILVLFCFENVLNRSWGVYSILFLINIQYFTSFLEAKDE